MSQPHSFCRFPLPCDLHQSMSTCQYNRNDNISPPFYECVTHLSQHIPVISHVLYIVGLSFLFHVVCCVFHHSQPDFFKHGDTHTWSHTLSTYHLSASYCLNKRVNVFFVLFCFVFSLRTPVKPWLEMRDQFLQFLQFRLCKWSVITLSTIIYEPQTQHWRHLCPNSYTFKNIDNIDNLKIM